MIEHNKTIYSKTHDILKKKKKITSGEGKRAQMVALINIYNNCSIFSSFSTGKSKTT